MKKSFLLFPLVAMALTACSSNESSSSADVTDANTAWQTDVQPAEMPSGMTQPNYMPPAQPAYQPAPQPSYSYGGASETVGSCQVVRDGRNAPIYAQIQKGCYTDSQYTVGRYDTVYLVAYLAGKSVGEIASMNNLRQPYQLKVGQTLRVR